MPRSPSPERHQSVRRRGGGSQMLLHHHQHRRRSPSPPPRRSLRPRRAAAASTRPLVDDFFPFPSSPSSSPSRPRQRRTSPEPSSSDSGGGGGSSASDRRRRKLKLVVKLSQLPPDQNHRRAPPPPSYSDDSDGEELVGEGGSGDEEQVKPPKKRRIEQRGDRSRHREVGGGRSDAASAPRTKRLPVPGTARTTPLPDRKALDMILDKLQKKDTYGVFAEPVDLEELPDYHDVIEHPMDFGTVRRKLARNAYRSFEQFEDDIFLICSNAMQYNAPDTIYFRQAHSIQELARKKFQELRDEGIPTENQIKSEHKVRPNSCNREPIKKPVLRYSDDDLGFLSRKEQFKRPNSKNSEDDISFKDQVKKPMFMNSQNESSIFHKERVKKPISRNSEDDKKLISKNLEDDRSSLFGKEQVRKVISRKSENDESSSVHKQQVKKLTSQSSKGDFSSQKKHNRKPICRNREDPDFSSGKDPVENPICTNVEDAGFLSTKRVAEKPVSRDREDLGHYREESYKKPRCRDGQDEVGYSCNKEAVKKPVRMNSQDALGSDVSAATIASAGDGSNGLIMSQDNTNEPAGCTVANGFLDKDISSPLDEIRSEKTDDISAKPSYKSIVVDETRRKTYDTSEEQPSLESDPIFDVFSAEPKELINVGLQAEHSYAYARSLACFAGSLGAQGWRIASERIRQALPAEVKYGRGWVGEYEPPLPSILVVNDQSRYLKSSEANMRRNASLPRDNERLRPTESNNSKDMSLSLLNRITTSNNVVGVPGPLESPEFKPRLFGVTAEPQHRSTDTLSPHENHRVSGKVAKTKRTTNDKMRKGNSSSSFRALEMQSQKSEFSKRASSGVLDVPALDKMAGQPRPFFQPPESIRTQQMGKIDSPKISIPIETAPQRLECVKGASSGGHDMPSSNGLPKPFFQTQEATVPQPRNEATWVYRGRPGDGKVGTSNKSRPSTSVGFISKNQVVNAANFAMNVNGQKNINDHVKSVGSTAIPGQANIPNRGLDAPQNIFSAFPAAVRENQSIPSAPAVQSWISFGPSENKPAIDSNSGWKMPFANAHPSDDAKMSAVPQFFRQPVQVVRESPAQNKGLVIFPQLVQTDFSRSQGQPQWQGLVPHMQQKPSKDVLRPDLNIGFPSPGSPSARQSSGINLEAQQPDLALQL
ncbi:uncharacterized protein LOC133890820 isoform X2 [Phragmites australis]|uniref:uncharacterized protein LOC133890820 isoform X2 n=1 Tax=Phragmites australis TaxID=29695 RepID=UPI002D7A227E|nr:uncharacterized protein LOC133890820 isoform X2 [Phragmites australis]